MPIFDQGYQHWNGQLSGHAWRWLIVTRHGVRAQWKNRWTRILLYFALVPALGLAAVLIFWGLFEQGSSLVAPVVAIFRILPQEMQADPRGYRVVVWTLAFQYFFAFQIFFAMILVILVGPGLISQDLRFNAVPLYLSRPVRRVDYFLGKLGVIAVYLAGVAVAPLFIAYLLGIGFSLDLSVVRDTARLLLAAVAYGLVLVVSAGTLMLALSSLSRNSRYVMMMWAGLWIVSNIVAGVLTGTVRRDWCPLASYTGNVQRVGHALLDTRGAWGRLGSLFTGPRGRPMDPDRREQMIGMMSGTMYPWYWSAAVLAALLGLSLWIMTSRVKSLDRLK